MLYDNYESVSLLDSAAQHALLFRGDAVERIWAAWSLALKAGRQIIPDLRESLRSSPSPGTRRHLLVVLAGFGEHSILERCAAEDPDDYVRSTAVQYLLRTASGRVKPQLINRILADPSPMVRMAVLQEMDASNIRLRTDQIGRLNRDPDPEVRRLSLEKFGSSSN